MMNVDEMVVDLRRQRDIQTERIEEARKIRSTANEDIKVATTELIRIDRLLRAAEGRKRTRKVISDGGPQ
jgi:hypothetical protein